MVLGSRQLLSSLLQRLRIHGIKKWKYKTQIFYMILSLPLAKLLLGPGPSNHEGLRRLANFESTASTNKLPSETGRPCHGIVDEEFSNNSSKFESSSISGTVANAFANRKVVYQKVSCMFLTVFRVSLEDIHVDCICWALPSFNWCATLPYWYLLFLGGLLNITVLTKKWL